MKRKYFSTLFPFIIVFLSAIIVMACKKDKEIITDLVSLEEYSNKTGHNLEITTYFSGIQQKKFSIQKDSLLSILNPMDPGTDSTGTIFKADSAKLVFDDKKSYMMIDTAKGTTNFLNQANFTTAIAPDGQKHYFRYSFTAAHYALAK